MPPQKREQKKINCNYSTKQRHPTKSREQGTFVCKYDYGYIEYRNYHRILQLCFVTITEQLLGFTLVIKTSITHGLFFCLSHWSQQFSIKA